MRVLVFTSLFPNNVRPQHGIFIQERMARVASFPGMQLRVVAPVPYFPPLPIPAWSEYSRVSPCTEAEGISVCHPRYFLLPKVSTRWHGSLMAAGVLSRVRMLRGEFPFDLIDAHFAYPDGFAAVEIGRKLNVPVVVSARGSDINVMSELPSVRPLLQRTVAGAAALIAVSRPLGEALIRLGASPEQVTVIPNGVDAAKFHPVGREEARAALGMPAGTLIVSVGHLTENKGFDRLLRAFSRLRVEKEHRETRLAIVGEGSYRRELEGLAAALGVGDVVRLAGAIPHAELFRWYAAADLTCLFSRREGWPNVVLESLACGTPVLATPVGGIPDALADPSVGALVDGDERSLADGLSAALARRWDRVAIRRYAEGHSWERVAESVVHVFRSAIAHG